MKLEVNSVFKPVVEAAWKCYVERWMYNM